MVAVLKVMVAAIATRKRPSKRWESALRGVLEGYLGRVPEEIEVDGKAVTPREYASSVLRIKAGDYRQVTSLGGQPFWRRVELLVPDNWMRHQDYWNMPVATMMDTLDAALRRGYTAAIDIDNSEPTTRRSAGRERQDVWTLSESLEKKDAVTDAIRQEMFDDRSTTDDHLMHVVGIARHRDGRTFYLTKDSFGVRGSFEGHRMISRNYLMAKMLSFMVHKDALGPGLAARFD
jgi:bleomycin hydrolase